MTTYTVRVGYTIVPLLKSEVNPKKVPRETPITVLTEYATGELYVVFFPVKMGLGFDPLQ